MAGPGPNSDNSHDVALLREFAAEFSAEGDPEFGPDPQLRRLAYLACADLLDCHDDTGMSLDDWWPARNLVEYCIGHGIDLNGV